MCAGFLSVTHDSSYITIARRFVHLGERMHRILHGTVGLLVFCLLIPIALFSARKEYAVTYDGSRVKGADICFFAASGFDSPSANYFNGQDKIVCLPADDVLDVPPGRWHVFARQKTRLLASASDELVVWLDPPRPDEGYELLKMPVVDAGVVDVSDILASLDRLDAEVGLWLDSTANTSNVFIPRLPGDKSILVPAGIPFVPLVFSHGSVIAVGKPATAQPGETERIGPDIIEKIQHPTGCSVITWVKVDRTISRIARRLPLQDPGLTLDIGDAVLSPIFPLRNALAASGTIQIFKDAPAGRGSLKLVGDEWEEYQRSISADCRGVQIIEEPIPIVPASTVDVSCTLGQGGPLTKDCSGGELRQEISVELLQCQSSSDACRTVRRATLDLRTTVSTATFSRLSVGEYWVELKSKSGAVAERRRVFAPPAEHAKVDFTLRPFIVFGRVHKGDKPVQAHLEFSSGASASTETGEFTATLPAPPGANNIHVHSCDGTLEYVQVVKEPITNAAFVDIEIPERSLAVLVRSTTGATIQDATVWFSVLKEPGSDTVRYSSERQTTDTVGATKFENVPNEPLAVCAQQSQYPRKCVKPPLDPPPSEMTIELQREQTFYGRIVAESASGMLVWASSGGVVTEQARVSADGRFEYHRIHAVDEVVYYASPARPLYVMSYSVADPSAEWQVQLPDAPLRQADVTIAEHCSSLEGVLGLWAGNNHIPLNVVALSQQFRGHDVEVRRGETLTIGPVVSAQPLSVALGPPLASLGGSPVQDPFGLPEYASTPRRPLDRPRVELCAF